MSKPNDIDKQSTNRLLPIIPDICWNIFQEDVDSTTMPGFFLIQAFFSSTITEPPQLVVDSLKVDNNGVPFQSLVRFSYPGQIIPMKGFRVLSEGVDRFGNVIISSTIGDDPLTDISEVKVFGGQGGH